MKVSRNICDARGCKRVAVEAFDVRPSVGTGEPRHYEVCRKHAELFDGGGWLRSDVAERIRLELVPS